MGPGLSLRYQESYERFRIHDIISACSLVEEDSSFKRGPEYFRIPKEIREELEPSVDLLQNYNEDVLNSERTVNKVLVEPGMIMGMANVTSTLVALVNTKQDIAKLQSSDDFVSFYGSNNRSFKRAASEIAREYSICSTIEKIGSTNDSPSKTCIIVSRSPNAVGLTGEYNSLYFFKGVEIGNLSIEMPGLLPIGLNPITDWRSTLLFL